MYSLKQWRHVPSMWDDAINEEILMADKNFKFCTACGRKVALSAKFCAECGADLSGGSEKILGCIDNTRTRGSNRTSLVFTTNRIIVAETESFALEILSGLPVTRWPVSGARRKKEREFHTLNPEEVLGANKKNYAIPYSEITQLRVRKPTGSWGGLKNATVTLATRLEEKAFILFGTSIIKSQYLKETEKTLEFLPKLKQDNRLGNRLIIEN